MAAECLLSRLKWYKNTQHVLAEAKDRVLKERSLVEDDTFCEESTDGGDSTNRSQFLNEMLKQCDEGFRYY